MEGLLCCLQHDLEVMEILGEGESHSGDWRCVLKDIGVPDPPLTFSLLSGCIDGGGFYHMIHDKLPLHRPKGNGTKGLRATAFETMRAN